MEHIEHIRVTSVMLGVIVAVFGGIGVSILFYGLRDISRIEWRRDEHEEAYNVCEKDQ